MRSKKLILSIIIIFIILATAAFIVFKLYKYEIDTKHNYSKNIDLTKEKKLDIVFQELNIKQTLFFKIFLKIEKNSGKNIKVGNYKIVGNYSYKDIIEILEKGTNRYIAFTIPEGSSINEIGRILEKRKLGTSEKFKEALKEIKDFPYLTPKGNLEGYLYCETYHLGLNFKEKDLVDSMLKEFLKKFPPEEYPDKEKFYKDLIMASIIEREAQLEDEKPLMSSVFHNRLKIGMKLQSDATTNFVYDYTKRRMFFKDLKIDSPYNTYRYHGLPPAPIANPDYNSMMAAMNPSKTDYLFFVVTSAGKHTFTKTYREHLKVQKIKK